jgi:hypothetical protein
MHHEDRIVRRAGAGHDAADPAMNVVVRVGLQRSLRARAPPDPHRIERVLAAGPGRPEGLERRAVQDLRHDGLADVLRGDGIGGAHIARLEQGIGIAA